MHYIHKMDGFVTPDDGVIEGVDTDSHHTVWNDNSQSNEHREENQLVFPNPESVAYPILVGVDHESSPPPPIDEILMNAIKEKFVFQHKTNGLFTYRKPRRRPSTDLVDKYYRLSYEPYVKLTKLDNEISKEHTGSPGESRQTVPFPRKGQSNTKAHKPRRKVLPSTQRRIYTTRSCTSLNDQLLSPVNVSPISSRSNPSVGKEMHNVEASVHEEVTAKSTDSLGLEITESSCNYLNENTVDSTKSEQVSYPREVSVLLAQEPEVLYDTYSRIDDASCTEINPSEQVTDVTHGPTQVCQSSEVKESYTETQINPEVTSEGLDQCDRCNVSHRIVGDFIDENQFSKDAEDTSRPSQDALGDEKTEGDDADSDGETPENCQNEKESIVSDDVIHDVTRATETSTGEIENSTAEDKQEIVAERGGAQGHVVVQKSNLEEGDFIVPECQTDSSKLVDSLEMCHTESPPIQSSSYILESSQNSSSSLVASQESGQSDPLPVPSSSDAISAISADTLDNYQEDDFTLLLQLSPGPDQSSPDTFDDVITGSSSDLDSPTIKDGTNYNKKSPSSEEFGHSGTKEQSDNSVTNIAVLEPTVCDLVPEGDDASVPVAADACTPASTSADPAVVTQSLQPSFVDASQELSMTECNSQSGLDPSVSMHSDILCEFLDTCTSVAVINPTEVTPMSDTNADQSSRQEALCTSKSPGKNLAPIIDSLSDKHETKKKVNKKRKVKKVLGTSQSEETSQKQPSSVPGNFVGPIINRRDNTEFPEKEKSKEKKGKKRQRCCIGSLKNGQVVNGTKTGEKSESNDRMMAQPNDIEIDPFAPKPGKRSKTKKAEVTKQQVGELDSSNSTVSSKSTRASSSDRVRSKRNWKPTQKLLESHCDTIKARVSPAVSVFSSSPVSESHGNRGNKKSGNKRKRKSDKCEIDAEKVAVKQKEILEEMKSIQTTGESESHVDSFNSEDKSNMKELQSAYKSIEQDDQKTSTHSVVNSITSEIRALPLNTDLSSSIKQEDIKDTNPPINTAADFCKPRSFVDPDVVSTFELPWETTNKISIPEVRKTPCPPPAHCQRSTLKVIVTKPLPAHNSTGVPYNMYSQLYCVSLPPDFHGNNNQGAQDQIPLGELRTVESETNFSDGHVEYFSLDTVDTIEPYNQRVAKDEQPCDFIEKDRCPESLCLKRVAASEEENIKSEPEGRHDASQSAADQCESLAVKPSISCDITASIGKSQPVKATPIKKKRHVAKDKIENTGNVQAPNKLPNPREVTRTDHQVSMTADPFNVTPVAMETVEDADPGDDESFPVISCDICADEAKFICSLCQTAAYCSNKCQIQDWETHELECVSV